MGYSRWMPHSGTGDFACYAASIHQAVNETLCRHARCRWQPWLTFSSLQHDVLIQPWLMVLLPHSCKLSVLSHGRTYARIPDNPVAVIATVELPCVVAAERFQHSFSGKSHMMRDVVGRIPGVPFSLATLSLAPWLVFSWIIAGRHFLLLLRMDTQTRYPISSLSKFACRQRHSVCPTTPCLNDRKQFTIFQTQSHEQRNAVTQERCQFAE